jgi:hypothetical protein
MAKIISVKRKTRLDSGIYGKESEGVHEVSVREYGVLCWKHEGPSIIEYK